MGKVRFEFVADVTYINTDPGLDGPWNDMTGDYYPAADYEALERKLTTLVEAGKAMLEMYLRLADSGDCGFWDAHKEKEVIALKAAIAAAEARA